jgi:hypothetical protein
MVLVGAGAGAAAGGGVLAAGAGRRGGGGRHGRGAGADGHHVGLGRIAHAHVRAALELGLEIEGPGAAGGIGHRDADAEIAAIGLHLAEGVVLLHLAGGQNGGAELHVAVGRKPDLVLVQVIAGGDLETGLEIGRIDQAGGLAEGLLRFQELLVRVGDRGEQKHEGKEETHEGLRSGLGRRQA